MDPLLLEAIDKCFIKGKIDFSKNFLSMIMKLNAKMLNQSLPASNTDSFTTPSEPLLVMTIFGD